MLNLNEINDEILMLESKRDTTYSVIEKLSQLYVVRDHLSGCNTTKVVDVVPVKAAGDSEFLEMVSGKDSIKAWAVIDEHMSVLKAVYPKQYKAILNRIALLD